LQLLQIYIHNYVPLVIQTQVSETLAVILNRQQKEKLIEYESEKFINIRKNQQNNQINTADTIKDLDNELEEITGLMRATSGSSLSESDELEQRDNVNDIPKKSKKKLK